MIFFGNLSIRTKIVSVLVMFGLLCAFLVSFGSVKLMQASTQANELVNNQSESLRVAALAMEHSTKIQSLWYEILSAPPAARTDLLGKIAQEKKAMAENFTILRPFIDGPDVARFATIEAGMRRYDTVVATIPALLDAGQQATVSALMQGNVSATYDRVDDAFNAIVEQQKSDLASATSVMQDNTTSALWALIIAAVAGLVVIGTIALVIVRRQIVDPIVMITSVMAKLAKGDDDVVVEGADRRDEVGDMAKGMVMFRAQLKATEASAEAAKAAQSRLIVDSIGTALEAMAQGDLTARVDADLVEPFARLKTNFNDAASTLCNLIGAVSEGAEGIRTGAHEIAQASEDLARRTEGNAASLEETSAAIQQIDARLKTTASAAERSVSRSGQTMIAVDDGRARTDQAVQAMGRVSESAKGIDGVIEGLDKIAFQTRVLAMNAAVEAGRAGDAGRGFAVVADLVSALAMRAEEEAKRARDQLTVTQSEIGAAVDAVEQVEGALTNIFTAGQEAATLVQQIATDNLAQASAISQISAAINTMDQSTQQNAAMVEETSAAARNLTSEVTILNDQAKRFDVGGDRSRTVHSNTPAKSSASAKIKPSPAYKSPVKALPAMAGGSDDTWSSF